MEQATLPEKPELQQYEVPEWVTIILSLSEQAKKNKLKREKNEDY